MGMDRGQEKDALLWGALGDELFIFIYRLAT